ncbi:hypothetical protein ACINLE_07260 [Bacillus sp. z60-18]|uniref:hypothetical protein n=1 Tax=unclassified Bacillus (in: firmicutes) TaxID=185979 RepID=UPI00390C9BF8
MNYPYKQVGIDLDRDFRIPVNENFVSIEKDFKAILSDIGSVQSNSSLTINSGKVYPLSNKKRDGVLYSDNQIFMDAVLDIKVFNANPGKWYRFDYIANGATDWGDPVWFLQVVSMDAGTFDNQTILFNRGNPNLNGPFSGIETHVLSRSGVDETFSITLNWDKVTKTKVHLLTESGGGYGYIIDPSNYFFTNRHSYLGDSVVAGKSGEVYTVKFQYNEFENRVIEFAPLRNNNFTSFHTWVKQPANTSTDNFGGEEILRTSTDFVSPYGLLAKNNTVSTASFTVGGAHGTDGTSGFPTGRHIKTVMSVDGAVLNDGEVKVGKTVTIVAEHMVSASNVIDLTTGDKRDVMKETVTYTITKNSIDVEVTLESLEDATITRYAGLQSTKLKPLTNFYPMYDTTGDVSTESIESGESINKDPATLDRFVVHDEANFVICKTDRTYGLGSGEYLNGSSPVYWTQGEYGKIYAHNIPQNSTVDFPIGTKFAYRGGYYFADRIGTVGYCYRIKDVYYVDFLAAESGVIAFDPFETVELVSTQGDVTYEVLADNQISFNSTGTGQIAFRLR